MNSEIIFGTEELKDSFEKLTSLKNEEKKLYDSIIHAFENIEKNAFCGIQIPKRLIPKEYHKKFGKLDNLWKYNLPNAWRLLYTVKRDEIVILCIILEWLSHKEYERRFKY